jgi:hypothetical protein
MPVRQYKAFVPKSTPETKTTGLYTGFKDIKAVHIQR